MGSLKKKEKNQLIEDWVTINQSCAVKATSLQAYSKSRNGLKPENHSHSFMSF